MKNRGTRHLLTGMAALGLLVLGGLDVSAGDHPAATITLKDADGATVTNGKPYSPKQTCGTVTTGCHSPLVTEHALDGSVYEADFAVSNKTQKNNAGATISYAVPYPQHGVTAGYHFQQGRNLDWNETRQAYYGVPAFTSSPGMFGKY